MPQQVQVQNGVAVNVGFAGGLSISTPNITASLITQSASLSADATRIMVEDEVGNGVVSDWVDPHMKATLEFVIKGTGLANAITTAAALISMSTLFVQGQLYPGALITISACQQMPSMVGIWEVVSSPEISGDNKNAKKIRVPIEYRPGIQAVATA